MLAKGALVLAQEVPKQASVLAEERFAIDYSVGTMPGRAPSTCILEPGPEAMASSKYRQPKIIK